MAKKDIKKDLRNIHTDFDKLGVFFYVANPATERKAKQHKLFDFIGDRDTIDVVHADAERGWVVATTGVVIVAQKQDGIEKTINYHKDGTTDELKYPAWHTVVPSSYKAEEKSVLKFRPQQMLNVVSAFTDVWSNLGTSRDKKNTSSFVEFQHSDEYVSNGVETITFNAKQFKEFLDMRLTRLSFQRVLVLALGLALRLTRLRCAFRLALMYLQTSSLDLVTGQSLRITSQPTTCQSWLSCSTTLAQLISMRRSYR